MKPAVIKTEVPSSSKISTQLSGAYYFDSYKVRISNNDRTALNIYLEIVSKTPSWINYLMSIRNNIVSILGLKNLGHLGEIDTGKPESEYCVGDRVGIFSILSLSKQEVILGDSDNHLDAKLSVFILDDSENKVVTISTVVYVHNMLGRVYMLFVKPAHKLISPAMLRLVGVK